MGYLPVSVQKLHMFCIGVFFITEDCEEGYILCAGSSHIQGNVVVEPAHYCYWTQSASNKYYNHL